MHALDLVGVAEAGGLAVNVADAPDGVAGSLGGGDVLGGGGATGDSDAAGGDLELGLVEDHGVSAGLHERRGEGAVGVGVGPVLRGRVVPVDNALVFAVDAGDGAGDAATLRVGDVALQAHGGVPGEVSAVGGRDTSARELDVVRAVEAQAPVLGADVARVHVEVQVRGGRGNVGVDVTEERAAGRRLVLGDHHTGADGLRGGVAVDAVDLVVDEALGRVELGAGLAVDDEDVGALDGARGGRGGGGGAEGVLEGEHVATQAGEVTQLAGGVGLGDVGAEVNGRVARLGHDVLGDAAGLTGDLDDVADGGGAGGGAEAGADVGALLGGLQLDAAVLDGRDVAVGLVHGEDEGVGGAGVDDEVVPGGDDSEGGAHGGRGDGAEKEGGEGNHGCIRFSFTLLCLIKPECETQWREAGTISWAARESLLLPPSWALLYLIHPRSVNPTNQLPCYQRLHHVPFPGLFVRPVPA